MPYSIRETEGGWALRTPGEDEMGGHGTSLHDTFLDALMWTWATIKRRADHEEELTVPAGIMAEYCQDLVNRGSD